MTDAGRRLTRAGHALMERMGQAPIDGLAPGARPRVSLAEGLDDEGRVTWSVTARPDAPLPGA